jgi:hypothetical protein
MPWAMEQQIDLSQSRVRVFSWQRKLLLTARPFVVQGAPGWMRLSAMVEAAAMDSGEKRLRDLGYKQELRRTLSYEFPNLALQLHSILHFNFVQSCTPTSFNLAFQLHSILHSNFFQSCAPTSFDLALQLLSILRSNFFQSCAPTSFNLVLQLRSILHFNLVRSCTLTSFDLAL